MNKEPKIAITTGDIDGIGLEVAAKALDRLKSDFKAQLFLWRHISADKKYLKLIDKRWNRITVGSLDEGLRLNKPGIIDIASNLHPANWVETTGIACLNKQLDAIATGPISKTGIIAAGLSDLGHTDILKRISKSHNVNMGFLGSHFNVVLSTGHIPLDQVTNKLKIKTLCGALYNANLLKNKLSPSRRNCPIAVLGLNPHSGENGLIGSEEGVFFPQLATFAQQNNIPISGPLVPDSAFLKQNWKKYSVFLALYHDQGLIPFKTIHGQDSGVHVSLGLPFVRTSVDHGTAKDIFGKNIANPNSMLDAIHWAAKLARL